MNFMVILLLLTPGLSFASIEELSVTHRNHIVLHDTSLDKTAFQKHFPRTIVYDRSDQTWAARSDSMPVGVQNKMWVKAGLFEQVKGWDQFERDLMVNYLRSFNMTFLSKKYPKVSVERLKTAQHLIAQYDKERRFLFLRQ